MKLKGKDFLEVERIEGGVPKIKANNELDLYYGLGYCHALDRGIQMMVMRILGSGTASEHLKSSEEMFDIDKFFRSAGWTQNVTEEINKFTESELELLDSYCKGVNHSFSKNKPWELSLLLKYKKFDWAIEDIILLSRMTGFLTLAQSQGEIERLFIEMVQNGISKDLLEELFPSILDNYDEDIIKKIKLIEKNIPDAVRDSSVLAPMMASNNWVVSGTKTKSGFPLLANDPHLEINRLPSVWCEVSFELGAKRAHGMSMPGISALLIGSNNDIAWGTTYTFMDAIDSWIEECRDGKYLKDGNWIDFNIRKEKIKRKGKEAKEVVFYENEHGVLQGNPFEAGYYLTTLWSAKNGGAKSIKNGMLLLNATTVESGMDYLGQFEMAFNWVLADKKGNIGYQMSGLLPKRKEGNTGFIPLIGWDSKNDWDGFYAHKDLPNSYNPESGMLVTANEKIERFGGVDTQTIAMGAYRSERITNLLKDRTDLTVEDMEEMHYDVYSIQAERFMKYIIPLLPETENGDILKNWDLCYDVNSKGAYLFEQIYRNLYAEVFSSAIGVKSLDFLQNETGIMIDFYDNFDKILLKEDSKWFGEKGKKELYSSAILKGLKNKAKTWGEVNQFTLTNILLGEDLPSFLGFNKGPFPMPGGRATIHQGQVYRSNNRNTTFAPSCRMIVDFKESTIHTNLSGGVSDRRFSKYYWNDFKNWQNMKYKKIKL